MSREAQRVVERAGLLPRPDAKRATPSSPCPPPRKAAFRKGNAALVARQVEGTCVAFFARRTCPARRVRVRVRGACAACVGRGACAQRVAPRVRRPRAVCRWYGNLRPSSARGMR